jgi:hypothetical protein
MGRARRQQQAVQGQVHARDNFARYVGRKPVVWPVGMYGSPISMREDHVTAYDVEVFFAVLRELSGDTVEMSEVKAVLEQLIGPNSDTSCERWAKGVNGTRVPMRENVITVDDEDILTDFFNKNPLLDPARVEEVLATILTD